MKKILLNIFLVTCITIGFAGQSWAFAWRGHHHNGPNDSGQDSSSGFTSQGDNAGAGNNDSGPDFSNQDDPGNTENGLNLSDYIPQGGDPGADNSDWGSNSDWDNGGNQNDPADPVPEPMTLALFGMGLAVIVLKRRIC